MAFFTSAYKLLAHLAPNWDTQLRTDMQSLEDNLFEQPFTPGFGGTGATIGGSGAGVNGFFSRKGRQVSYFGQIVFGTSASFGPGTPLITGLNIGGGDLSAIYVGGEGRLQRNAGGDTILAMKPNGFPNVSTVIPLVTTTGGLLNSLTAPAANDQLLFRVNAILY